MPFLIVYVFKISRIYFSALLTQILCNSKILFYCFCLASLGKKKSLKCLNKVYFLLLTDYVMFLAKCLLIKTLKLIREYVDS